MEKNQNKGNFSDIPCEETKGFAHEMPSEFWDSMVSNEINMDQLHTIAKVLDFVKDDY